MPGKAYYADVVAEVLAPKLGPDAHVLGQLVDLLLKVNVTERSAMFIAWKEEGRKGRKGRKERNVLFNDAINTFYLRLYGVG